jgi:hypothetical protein
MERDEVLRQLFTASTPNETSTALTDARAWLRDHPRDHQVAFSMLELLSVDRQTLGVPAWDDRKEWRTMKKIALMVASTVAFMTVASGTALAGSTEAPSPSNIVEGAGGATGNGADATAFTGGDTSTVAIVALLLVAAGLLALWIAHRRTQEVS